MIYDQKRALVAHALGCREEDLHSSGNTFHLPALGCITLKASSGDGYYSASVSIKSAHGSGAARRPVAALLAALNDARENIMSCRHGLAGDLTAIEAIRVRVFDQASYRDISGSYGGR